jgi:hypothetical protein
MTKYTWEQLKFRVDAMNIAKQIFLSNQYGMIFLLNEEGQILLNLTDITESGHEETPAGFNHLISK